MSARVRGLAGGLAGYPRQFWVLVLGTFVYCAGAGLAFPLEGLYLRSQPHSSWLCLGWPLSLTASNAMVADMLPHERRTEAYSIIRTAMNVGVVLGPAVGGL